MKRKLVNVFAFVVTCAILLIYRESLVALLAPADLDDQNFTEVDLDDASGRTEPTALAGRQTSAIPTNQAPRHVVLDAGNYGSSESTELLLEAARNLSALPTIEADIRHSAFLFGQRLAGTGKYIQGGQGSSKARLELTFSSDDFSTDITQINDGRFLYTIVNEANEAVAKRVDLTSLAPNSPDASYTGNAKRADVTNWMKMGGLSFLTQQLATDFKFASPTSSSTGDNEQVLLTGTWKRSRLANICGKLDAYDDADRLIVNRLPTQLPTHVEIVLSQVLPFGMFPSRITWLRVLANEDHSSLQEIASFEFHNVCQRIDLPVATFQIEKNVARVSDITETVVKNADRALRLR